MGTGWSLAFFAAAAVLAASLATAALAGELCRLPVRRIAAVSTIAALLLICGEVLALFSLGRPELIFGILANPSTGLFREFAAASAAAAALLGLVWVRRRCALRRTCLLFAAAAALLALGAVAAVGTVLWMPWRAGWHTATMALPLLGLVCPATALILRLFSEDGLTSFNGVEHCFIALMPALGAAIWLGTLAWGPAPMELPTASRLLSGDLALPFWIGFVLLGILIPAAVLVLSAFSPMFRFGNFIGLTSAAAAAAAIARTTELLGGASGWRFFLT